MTLEHAWTIVYSHATKEWADMACWEHHNEYIKDKFGCEELEKALRLVEEKLPLKNV